MIRRAAKVSMALASLVPAAAATAAADPATYMPTQLIAHSQSPRPGSTVLLGFRMSPKRGWHGYWSNPGDSGLVPTVQWSAPDGVTFGPLLHPAPTLISDSGIDSFVHEGPHVLLARMKVPASLARGTPIPVKAKLNWAACTATRCVPLSATFTLDLVAGDGAKASQSAALESALRKVPAEAADARFTASGGTVMLELPRSLAIDRSNARFFPDENGSFDAGKGKAVSRPGGWALVGPAEGPVPDRIGGVLSDGSRAYRMTFRRGEAQEKAAAIEERVEPVAPDAATAAIEPASAEPPAEIAAAPKQREGDDRRLWLWALLAAAAVPAGALALRRARRR